MEGGKAVDCVHQLSAMKSLRTPHVETWRKSYSFTYPIRMHGFFGEIVTAEDGLSELARLNDSTTTESARIFTSHLQEGMTPSNALWFGISLANMSEEERRWLDNAAKTIWQNIHNSNYDAVSFECRLDLTIAGWYVLYCDEAEGGGYHFEQWPLSECYIASTRPGRPVDTVYREFELRADQAFNTYGEAVSEKIKECIAKGKPHEKFQFIHRIFPRKKWAADARMAKNMRYASEHVEVGTKKMVRESGYHEFPCVIPRWMQIPGTSYAVGAVYEALADAATLNKIKEFDFANMDLAIGGMWIAEDDGVLNPRAIKIGARKVIVANSVNSMAPLQPSSNFNVAFTAEDRIQAQIRKILLADILPPLEGQPRTAAEINMRMAFIRKMMGPAYARVQNEDLQKLVERCFGIALRAGILGQPPESLRGRTWFVKYKNPLARAQQLNEVTAIDEYAAGLANWAATTGDQSVLDNIDMDKAARHRGEALGVPWEIIPTEDNIREKRLQREEARQEMAQEQMGQQIMTEAGTAAAKKAFGA